MQLLLSIHFRVPICINILPERVLLILYYIIFFRFIVLLLFIYNIPKIRP